MEQQGALKSMESKSVHPRIFTYSQCLNGVVDDGGFSDLTCPRGPDEGGGPGEVAAERPGVDGTVTKGQAKNTERTEEMEREMPCTWLKLSFLFPGQSSSLREEREREREGEREREREHIEARASVHSLQG